MKTLCMELVTHCGHGVSMMVRAARSLAMQSFLSQKPAAE